MLTLEVMDSIRLQSSECTLDHAVTSDELNAELKQINESIRHVAGLYDWPSLRLITVLDTPLSTLDATGEYEYVAPIDIDRVYRVHDARCMKADYRWSGGNILSRCDSLTVEYQAIPAYVPDFSGNVAVEIVPPEYEFMRLVELHTMILKSFKTFKSAEKGSQYAQEFIAVLNELKHLYDDVKLTHRTRALVVKEHTDCCGKSTEVGVASLGILTNNPYPALTIAVNTTGGTPNYFLEVVARVPEGQTPVVFSIAPVSAASTGGVFAITLATATHSAEFELFITDGDGNTVRQTQHYGGS